MSKIIVNGSLIPSTKNAPLDIRTRVNTIEEVSSIQMPFIGMIFYVIDEDKFYVVKKLKNSIVGSIEIKDSSIDVFEPLININVDGIDIDLSKYATKEFVEEQIAAIEHPQYDISHLATKEEVKKLHEDKYVIKGLPEGSLVDRREKEIRIMVPADAEFVQQEVGEGGNANMYYMSLTSKAPEGAVRLIESDGNKTEEINLDGKKSKTIWLALAMKSGDAWNYFGKSSTVEKFIGWSYTLKWIDEAGAIIESDRFRINLSNESCHDDLMPYLGAPIASKTFVKEQISQIELKEGPAGVDGKDFTYDMFTEEQLEALRGPAGKDGKDGAMGLQGLPGKDGVNGKDGVDGADGKSFTYDMFTEEQLADLKGDKGDKGDPFTYEDFTDEQLNALKGMDGVKGDRGLQGEPGKDGENGQDGISITNVEIVEGHLMVTLSNEQVLDAGELPAVSPEVEKELAETKQQLLDLTYGVEYEWIYFCEQDEELNSIGFNRETAPKFYEEIDAALETEDEAIIEEFIINMYEQDIYRMYVLRVVSEHKYANRYELLPLIDNPHQSRSEFLAKWNATSPVEAWNVDIENDVNGFEFEGGFPTSPLVLAFLKIKK